MKLQFENTTSKKAATEVLKSFKKRQSVGRKLEINESLKYVSGGLKCQKIVYKLKAIQNPYKCVM